MEYRYLGRSGLKVSELCLGAMTFGRETEEAESRRILDAFVDAGGMFIDTANGYSRGLSEEILGRWLADRRRDELVIATKVRFPMGDGPNDTGLSRKHIMQSVDDSLRRLSLDYIDLYQVHCWDAGTELEEYLRTLDDLVRSGKVRHIGASNFTGWQLQKALDYQRRYGLEPFRSLQPQYNLLARGVEWEVLPVTHNEGLGVIPWSPLKGGWLSGRYRRGMDAPPAGSRVEEAAKHGWSEQWSNLNKESTWRVLDALHAAAEGSGKHPVQIALRWVLERPGVTSPIIGVRTMEHLTTALGATGWTLDDELRASLDEASRPDDVYPYDFIRRAQEGR
ncbi:MAG: aldo/keto reductase [Spirochaetales bacterium]|nr:aldo/keto reductase [Spirochaetales bacterium]